MRKPVWIASALAVTLAANAAIAVPVSLLLWLRFDEGSGTTATNIGTLGAQADGTIFGATYSTNSAFGSGFSLLLDGDADYVAVPDAFDYGNKLTVEAWIQPDVVDGQRIIYDDYGNPGVLLAVSGGKLQWTASTSMHPGTGISVVAGSICAGLWQYVVGTYDGSMLRAYVNGVEVGSVATTGNILDNGSNPTHVGAESGTPTLLEFAGRIDELRVQAEAIVQSFEWRLCGELTGDCQITTTDSLAALRMAVGSLAENPAADVDGSGSIVAIDALAVLRIAVGIDEQTNACNTSF